MLGDEPDLELMAAEHLAHEEVVGPIVAVLGRSLDRVANLARMISWASRRRESMAGTSSTPVGGSGTSSPRPRGSGRQPPRPQGLDPLSQEVDHLELLVSVLIQQEVQLVEGMPPYQPVVLLVEAMQDDAVGQDVVQ